MTLPETLTLIRHGHSEANYVQEMVKQYSPEEVLAHIPAGLRERHDANMRLTKKGIEQAQIAGAWLREYGFDFDRFYTSPHTRTRETAVNLALDERFENVEWRVDDRFRERDWGELKYVNFETGGDPLDADSRHNRSLSQWYWKPLAGESLSTGVRLRVESIKNSMYRKTDTKHMVGVTHGETMRTFQFVIERMTPDQWEKMDADEAFKMRNTMIIQYSRHEEGDPEAPMSRHFAWRRAVCPWDESLSWQGGQWQPVAFKKFSTDELRQTVERFKPLF